MQYDSQDSYLETEILTATPQKLQLLLINGAIRFTLQAKQLKENGDDEQAWESLLRCREIIAEILSGIKHEGNDVIRQVASIYLFLFRELSEIQINDEYEKLAGVAKVLEIERETWSQLCELEPEALERPVEEVKEITAADMPAVEESETGPSIMDSPTYTSGFDTESFTSAPHFRQSIDSNANVDTNSTGSSGLSLDA
ncbi:MAG: flagellar export chaperone FliS [Pirellulales bacterium]